MTQADAYRRSYNATGMSDNAIWRDNRRFFNKGKTGQWRDALSEESLSLSEEVKADRVPPALGEWLEKGTQATGDPKTL